MRFKLPLPTTVDSTIASIWSRMRVKLLTDTAVMPTRGTEHSAGLDLYVDTNKKVSIYPGATKMLGTGIAAEIPKGCFGAIFPRSGLSTKKGIVLANDVAVIDSDYRGEIKLPLFNRSKDPQTIDPHERVAQMVIIPYVDVELVQVDDLTDTERGDGGFGSTGKN